MVSLQLLVKNKVCDFVSFLSTALFLSLCLARKHRYESALCANCATFPYNSRLSDGNLKIDGLSKLVRQKKYMYHKLKPSLQNVVEVGVYEVP